MKLEIRIYTEISFHLKNLNPFDEEHRATREQTSKNIQQPVVEIKSR